MTNHIVLFEPLFPANTGNIARTCAGTNTELHLIKPLGFSTDDKHMKRAGLDYWDKVKITYHEDLPSFMKTIPDINRLYIVSKFATHDLVMLIIRVKEIIISYLEKKQLACPNVLCKNIQKMLSGFHKMIIIFGP